MLSAEQNRTLTDTDAGSGMGTALRRHWIPFACAVEFPASDEPPRRLVLLGERLVMFRDSQGLPALFDEFCPHRRASLYFGRNEDSGIRCVYHGWKFDVTGRCIDLPSEPPSSRMKERVRARAYPVREAAGLMWAWMGEGEAPDLPDFAWMSAPPQARYASRWEQDCNFVQAMEGELDEAHVSFLHRRLDQPQVAKDSLIGDYFREDTAPRWRVARTPVGLACGARRTVDGGERHLWRINHFAAPFFTLIAPSDDPHSRIWRAWVPRDNTSCWVLCVTWRDDGPVGAQELSLWREGAVAHRRLQPGSTRPVENKDNDYLIDRAAQRSVSFTGVQGIRAQDALVVESAGAIVDRSRENLGSSDAAVVALRRLLLDYAAGARALPAGGKDYAVRAYAGFHSWPDDFDRNPGVMAAMGLSQRAQ